MPARSTPFQKLLLHLQTQLSPGCVVTESAFLEHRTTKSPREVDVVIRGTVGEHKVVVSIECIEHERAADVTWVEKMLKKHQHLETTNLLLVSLSGFSKDAVVLAASEGAEAYTPEEASKLDWARIVGTTHVTLARFDIAVLRVEAIVGETGRTELPGRLALFDRGGTSISTLADMVAQTAASDGYQSQIEPFLVDVSEAKLNLHMVLAGERFLSPGEPASQVREVFAVLKAVRSSTDIPLTSLTWRETPAAFGRAQTAFGDTTLTVVEPEPGQVHIQVLADGKPLPLKLR